MRLIQIICILIWAWPAGSFAQHQQLSLDDLVAMVNGTDPITIAEAIAAIGEREPTSELAIQVLLDALGDDRRAVFIPDGVPITFAVETVGSTAAGALAEIGKPAARPLREFIANSHDINGRKRAIRSLAQMGGDAAVALPILQRQLVDPQMEVRFEALAAVVSIQKDPRRLATVLGTVLSDESPDVRAAAVRALGELGESGSAHAARLVKLLDDKKDRWHFLTPCVTGTRPVRFDSAMALARMGRDGRIALTKLREMMNRDPDPLVRVAAAFAIAELDGVPQDAMQYLIAAIQDEENGVPTCEAAVQSLGKLGPKASEGLPTLSAALKHPDSMIRIHAVQAIVTVSPETAESQLLPVMNDKDPLLRACVIESLGSLEKASPQLLTSYIGALDDTDSIFGKDVRHAAAIALGNLQEKAATAIPRLTRMVTEEENERVKDAAVNAIRQITQRQTEGNRSKQ